MAKCKHEFEDGRTCRMDAQVLSGNGFCCVHDPDRSTAEKKRWRSKGGSASRKIQPWLISEAADLEVKDTTDLKRLYNSALAWLIAGKITPSQARALVAVGNGLKDVLELELYQQLVDLRQALEAQPDFIPEGEQWQLAD